MPWQGDLYYKMYNLHYVWVVMQLSHLSVGPVMNSWVHYPVLWLCEWRSSAKWTKLSPSKGQVYSTVVCMRCLFKHTLCSCVRLKSSNQGIMKLQGHGRLQCWPVSVSPYASSCRRTKQKAWIRTAGVRSEIWNWYLTNTNQRRCGGQTVSMALGLSLFLFNTPNYG
jgi:hypothetical protein